jgi:hypothetical protein
VTQQRGFLDAPASATGFPGVWGRVVCGVWCPCPCPCPVSRVACGPPPHMAG